MSQRSRADQASFLIDAAGHSRASRVLTRPADETLANPPLSSNAYTSAERTQPTPDPKQDPWLGALPKGESLLWTGSPDGRAVARRILHVRAFAAYFAAFGLGGAVLAAARGESLAAALCAGLGILPAALLTLALIAGFAVLVARTTCYAITERRVVMRFGIAIPVTLSLPFAAIRAADVKGFRDGSGEIALEPTDPRRVLYATLWPHARPWRFARPQPALRGLADVAVPARILGEALRRADGQAARPALRVVASGPATSPASAPTSPAAA